MNTDDYPMNIGDIQSPSARKMLDEMKEGKSKSMKTITLQDGEKFLLATIEEAEEYMDVCKKLVEVEAVLRPVANAAGILQRLTWASDDEKLMAKAILNSLRIIQRKAES